MDSNSIPTAIGATASALTAAVGERRCENADCNVLKMVSMVPKRKTTQFITEASIMDKPMLINGFTTVFQVDGAAAKLSDIKDASGTSDSRKPVYRIMPNTHAHIVNYVVVDADGDSLRKINENDPATMRKLLDSQKVSADQMLKKLMAGHSIPISAGAGPVAASNGTSAVNATGVLHQAVTGPVITSTASMQQSSAIQLPARMHPNLKITAIASGENLPDAIKSAPATAAPPLITPVPLANLQNTPPPASAVAAAAAVVSAAANIDKVDKPIFDKMQAELQELRRTVAMLAEAQAKKQPDTQVRGATAVRRPRQS